MTDQASQQAQSNGKSAAGTRPEGHEPSSVSQLNERTAKRQRMLLAGIATVILASTSWIIFGSDHAKKAHQEGDAETIETASLVNRNLSQREFTTVYGNQLGAVTREQKALKDGAVMRPEMEAELAALKAENQAMRTDGQAAIDAISAENTQLKNQLQTQAAAPAPNAAAMPAYGPRAGGYDARGPAGSPANSGTLAPGSTGGDGAPPPAEVKLMNFSGDKSAGTGVKLARADVPPLVVEDSPDYLPPNSYARARVIVGVDASAGVASQTDPLPVVLRITGPARSVLQNGRVLTTRLEGCVINGAARGDLSSEKVYVKLARMTCDQPGGRVAVSEVKGFISFAGKSGVRGRVVSREGNLVTQALLAGIVGGFGRGFSANANSVFSSTRTNPDGSKAKLSAGDILGGGLGQGAADAADTVSKYLIERAEQYQPVVEMPTGIEVEVVFLDGVYVRNSK